VQIKIEDLLERRSKHGLVGLKNLGNTCFMNSALQCLSNCEELTKYFLTRKAFDEINRNNSHGTGGEVAKAYYELMKELWQGDSNYLCPTDFRQIFVRFVRQFAGFSQHDSHEMLTFMLDALHEDLNRVRQKPYVEMNEKTDKETEVEASQRWWENHISRENSIIVDLFHGQYKSVITCPQCNRISITYDPFMYLGLPIPSGHFKIKFKFFPYLNEILAKNYIFEYELPINDHTTIKDMKYKVLNSRSNINIEFLEAVCLTKEKSFRRQLKDDELIFTYFDNGFEIVIYEKYPSTFKESEMDKYVTFYLHPSELVEERTMFLMKKSYQKLLSYPTVISLSKSYSVKDLFYYVLKSYRKAINLNEKNFSLAKFLENSNNRDYVEEEFKHCFTISEENEPFRIQVINNIPEPTGYFASKSNCEFCGSKCEYCSIPCPVIKFNTSLETLVSKQSMSRPFLLYVQILKMAKEPKVFENVDFLFAPSTKNLITKQSSINIYDCINLFRSEERLEKENAWYCSRCKSHQEAFKRLEIYKPPNFLIVQFKRFKIRSNSAVMGMIANKKNDVVIEYPIEGLDLREYVVGIEKEEAIYDLCGISQHFGGLSSGHYTALCKNFGKWYEFDDDRVHKASNSDVVTNSAYMLFFRKRSFNSK
jgi:ubiquitin carboxyl-terminal hydrolase 4/11/15